MDLTSLVTAPSKSPIAILETKGASFYWASFFLGKHYTQRVARLYRLCRHLDDMVDECDSPKISRIRILAVRQSLSSSAPRDLVIQDGLSLIKECNINKDDLSELIRGVDSDNDLVRLLNQDELLRYCYRVAGTVGLMMCDVLDSHNPDSKNYALNLGIAMQLTNICRDIKADALMNRIYIPANLIGPLKPSELIRPNENDQIIIKRAVEYVLALASEHYRRGELGLAYLPIRSRFAVLIAARIYRQIGVKLARQSFEYWHKRIVVSKPEKYIMTIAALVSAVFCIRFWITPQSSPNINHPFVSPVNVQSTLSLVESSNDA
jgi:phytoene synthase